MAALKSAARTSPVAWLSPNSRSVSLVSPWTTTTFGVWSPCLVKTRAHIFPPSSSISGRSRMSAPGERYADKGPERGRLHVEAAFADAERAVRRRRVALGARGLQFGDLIGAHVPLRIDRLDQQIADQADD